MNKELEALEVSKQLKDFVLEFVKNGLHRRFIHGSFDIIEKSLKALEIVKEKEVDVGWLKRASDLYHYNMGMGIKSYGALTPQEYDLLKEVLLWD